MNTPVRLAGFGLGLVAVFGAALGLGRVVGPDVTAPPPATHDTHSDGAHGTDGHEAEGHEAGGLAIAQDGYRLAPLTDALSSTDTQPFRFRIIGPDEATVTAFTPTHERDLHLIVVRRDLTGYQHLHPERAPDGTWQTPLKVAAPGDYRVFADFRPTGRDEPLTLGADVPAAGDYRPAPLPGPGFRDEVDGYTVTLDGDAQTGAFTFTVSRDGAPVTDLEPYLGANGHLIALRDGDLGYLHVHPEDGPGLRFTAEIPSPGTYRLFLDFQHRGTVRTAAFTITTEHGEPGHTHG
ncbi:hypothetical protein [Catenuloplanes japonicus]|uniref:hypothetical protein n=1 Tax=Catenuloplanes japonicus TaxID=33876 RepID=UPI00068E0CE0|nr:hypothetical protein [Catenuloplanes japonicus]